MAFRTPANFMDNGLNPPPGWAKADNQMADKEWRPSDWKNPWKHSTKPFGKMNPSEEHLSILNEQYEAGASAMFKAVIKYLWEKCTDHPITGWEYGYAKDLAEGKGKKLTKYPEHRFNCPQCMEQFKESE